MSAVSYQTIPARQLDADQMAAWHALLDGSPLFASPYFRPEYTRTVAEVRDDVEVCVLREREQPVGFFAFERMEGDVGRPVGGGMSNFQGVVAAPGTAWTAADLTRGAGLTTLQFHHQLTAQTQFDPYVEQRAASPYVDVSTGWTAYLFERRQAGVKRFNAFPREMRRLEAELGPLTFVPQTTDAAVLERLLEWKRAQYTRTSARGALQFDWAVEVLRRLLAIQGPAFWGTLSALYAGDRLIAAHLGMRSATEWHYWYPTYDPEVGRHSPGLVLLYEMAQWSAGMGIARINLGKGDAQYKTWFGTAATEVAVGQITVPPSLTRRLLGLASRFHRS